MAEEILENFKNFPSVLGFEPPTSGLFDSTPLAISAVDPGFPIGGAGRQPPTRALFGGNACESERIGSLLGDPLLYFTKYASVSEELLKLVFNKACPIICQMAGCTGFCQFGKKIRLCT